MTRILLWNADFWPRIGGLEVITAELAVSLKTSGFDVHVLAPSPGPNEYCGVPVHRLPTSVPESYLSVDSVIDLAQMVRKLILSVSPDLLHLNGIGSYGSLFLLAHKPEYCPALMTLHGEWSENSDPLARAIFDRASKIAVCSQSTLDYVLDNAPAAGPQTVLIRNALPVQEAPNIEADDSTTLLVLGRLSREKGFDLAIRAIKDLSQEFEDLKLLVAGSGIEEQALRQLTEELGLQQRVKFLGPVDRQDVPALIRRASIVVVPSRKEGFGLTALEAAWMERPVIASAVGGLTEVVRHNETGLLVETEDVEALSRAIRTLVLDSSLTRRLGLEARLQASRRFEWSRYVGQYGDLYRALLS